MSINNLDLILPERKNLKKEIWTKPNLENSIQILRLCQVRKKKIATRIAAWWIHPSFEITRWSSINYSFALYFESPCKRRDYLCIDSSSRIVARTIPGVRIQIKGRKYIWGRLEGAGRSPLTSSTIDNVNLRLCQDTSKVTMSSYLIARRDRERWPGMRRSHRLQHCVTGGPSILISVGRGDWQATMRREESGPDILELFVVSIVSRYFSRHRKRRFRLRNFSNISLEMLRLDLCSLITSEYNNNNNNNLYKSLTLYINSIW